MSRPSNSDSGQAGEHLVAADLLTRGLHVTKPLNTNGPHDLHFRLSSGWVTVQVKLGRVRTSTGEIAAPGGRQMRNILSDVLALVYLPEKRIRYVANIGDLPVELL